MSGKGKNYNSIIFLTTLSVYLGLVLVSGSACGLSNAALTKSFDLKNEIEFKDEFDNNPDKDFPALLAELVEEINEKEAGVNVSSSSTDFTANVVISSVNNNSGDFYQTSNENLGSLIRQTNDQKTAAFALKNFDSHILANISETPFNCAAENQLDTPSSERNTAEFAEFLDQKFRGLRTKPATELKHASLENTELRANGKQVFIVTRLPRASIDESLLKL